MSDLEDGESMEIQGSGSKPYVIRNVGGVYSCSCPAWRNQSIAIERRTCKHIRKLRGDASEEERIGGSVNPPSRSTKADEKTTDAPALLLAESWDTASDPTGWWLSEKLDGVRAYWTGTMFLSRQGNQFHAPDWFVAGLPKEPLDGELWLDRKKFQRTVSIVRRQDKSDHWKELRYVVFDAPALEKRFEDRLKRVEEIIAASKPEFAVAHGHQLCQGLEHLRTELARLEALGGEGLMMRRSGSRYETGRSATLLKVKSFKDAEARVVRHMEGAGRHKGRLGALEVELADGTLFSVGTGFSDREREDPPEIGSTITFRYQELTEAGVPRFPSYVGVRKPVSTKQNDANPVTTVKSASTIVAKSGGKRRFEFSEGSSDKFWEVSLNDCDVMVCYGRIGTNGQSSTKSFADTAAAQKRADKLIAEKVGKGYREVT